MSVGNLQLFKMTATNAAIEHYKSTFVVRGQKWLVTAWEERIFYIIAVITTVFKPLKINTLKTVRSELITTIM